MVAKLGKSERGGGIVGDVAAAADITINTKGGSMSAILKKSLAHSLTSVHGNVAGATVRFAGGQEAVIMFPADLAGGQLLVRKRGDNMFELALDSGAAVEVDSVTAAFLSLKKRQFETHVLDVSGPYDADSLDSVFAGEHAAMDAAAVKLKAALAKSKQTAKDKVK